MRAMPRAAGDSTVTLAPEAGRYELLVAGDGESRKIPLKKEQELVIGRAEDADVCLVGESVSRRHAILRVQAEQFTLEDLGSSNGTTLRGEPAPAHRAVPVALGESFMLGDFVLLVRAVRSRAKVRHIWNQESFEARVAEQCERSRESGGEPFFLLQVRFVSKRGTDPSQLIAAELNGSDVLARLDTNVWAVLLVDDSAADAQDLAARLESAIESAGGEGGVRLLAYPQDGTSANALIADAEPSATPVGGEPGKLEVTLRSPAMLELWREMEAVARGDINVLILGETGVGKDVLAQRVHASSPRRDRPFLRLNCAALAESLLETELFGHEKGAFTGALRRKPGLLESAEGGSVFLDEIGELPQRLQAKLLQVIENREILSVGSVKPKSIDVRFIAATNRDLEAEALSGCFRRDLYYRLAGYTALVPSLRERREDILPLAQGFLRRASAGRSTPTRIRDDAAVQLLDYAWPGNVRELRNIIERAVVLSEGRSIGPEHLPLEKMRSMVLVGGRSAASGALDTSEADLASLTPEERAERQRIQDALAQCAGNQSMAAELLGISRSTLVNRLKLYRLRRPRKGQ
jgi:two-component system, NtrC family, response regulator AtoC